MYGMDSGQDTVKDHAAKMVIGGTTSYLGNQIYGYSAYPINKEIYTQLPEHIFDYMLTEDK